jgi:hypothetical protein
MERTNRAAPTPVAVVGRPLHCYACGYDGFWQRSAQHAAGSGSKLGLRQIQGVAPPTQPGATLPCS